MKKRKEQQEMLTDPDTLIDKEQWAEASKKSAIYHHIDSDQHYADDHYRCSKCGCSAVFSAEDQKYTYEEQKRILYQRRFLCFSCFMTARQLKQKNVHFEWQWMHHKASLQNDRQFLTEWLEVMDQLSLYWKINHAMARHIEKRLVGLG